MLFFDILTLFPDMFTGVFGASIVKRAIDKGHLNIHIQDFREYATNKYRTVDDYPYGGDAGMLIKAEPLAAAIADAKKRLSGKNPKVVFLTPAGSVLTHAKCEKFLEHESLIIICGHYKGIDQRIRDTLVDYEISIGDYVLSGGEIPAMALVDSLARLIPGVLGDRESAEKDSFYEGLLEYPQYTRPEVWENQRVPEILLSGHHANIQKWQKAQSEEITRRLRPDIWEQYQKNVKTDKH